MNEKKPSIGFRTPNKELQDAFDKIQAELSTKKRNWESMRDSLSSMVSEFEADEKLKSIGPNEIIFLFTTLTDILIANIGMELTETHERLARIEEMVKELKRK